MKKAILWGAGGAVIATVVVGAIALMGVERIPIAEYIVFPGSMLAWLYKGDNYTSSQEFLLHAIGFGIPVNAVLGAMLGSCWAAGRAIFSRAAPTPE